MSESPANTIVQFLENFTARKFFSLVILVTFVAFLLWGFERYTGHFSVGRTSQEVDVLEKLVKLRTTQQLSTDEEFVREALLHRLRAEGTVSTSSGVPTYTPKAAASWKSNLASLAYRGIWGASPWIIFSLIVLIAPTNNKSSAFWGSIFISICFGIVAMIIPSPGGWWVILGVPWGLFLITIGSMLTIITINKRKKANNPNKTQK